jgi:hypothetical protein
MLLQYFTLVHVLISLVGIASGFGVLSGLIGGKLFPRWIDIFMVTTWATSVSGFFFPFQGITPGIIVGCITVIAMGIASYGLYIRRLSGVWCSAFVVGAILSQYLNVFVLLVQLFQKMPVLQEIAPTQTEPAFVLTQLLTLVVFLAIGFLAVKRFRSPAITA